MPWPCRGGMIKRLLVAVMLKPQYEWDELVIVAQRCSPLPKPTLVKLISKQLLHMLGLNAWGMGNVIQDATSQMEKDKYSQEMIRLTHSTYA